MEIKVNPLKIGDSYYLLIPKSILDVYSMEKWIKDFEFKISAYKNGSILSYKRIKKIEEKKDKQTKLKDFDKHGK